MKPIAIASLCVTLLGGAALAAGDDMTDTKMNEAIARFVGAGPQGARLRLADVTDFEWDTVRSYAATAPIELYRQNLGAGFELSDDTVRQLMDDSAVLIFLKSGRVVEEVVIGPPVFLGGLNGSAREPRHAILTVTTVDPGPYSSVAFVE